MGRFDSLEFGEGQSHRTETSQGTGYGETIKDARYFLELAENQFFCMEYERSLQSYSKAVGMDAGAVPGWIGQVYSLIALEEYREADLWLGKAIEIIGENAEFMALQALIAARKGEFDRACGYSDVSLEQPGTSSLPFIVRGELFLYGRRNGEQCFEQACAICRDIWQTRLLIVDSCIFKDTSESVLLGLKYLQPLLDLHKNRVEPLLRLARIRIRLGQRKEANLALDQIRVLEPDLTILPELYQQNKPRGFFARLFGG